MKEQILDQKHLMHMSERSILINADIFFSHCPYWFFMMVSLVSTITYFSSTFSLPAWPKIIESPFLMLHYWNGLLTSFSPVANEVKCEFRSTKRPPHAITSGYLFNPCWPALFTFHIEFFFQFIQLNCCFLGLRCESHIWFWFHFVVQLVLFSTNG